MPPSLSSALPLCSSTRLGRRQLWRRAARPAGWASTLGALALGLCAALPAQAGRPLVTEDAGVLDPGECELELYAAHERLRPQVRARGASAQGSCGVGHGVQAALALERQRASGTEDAGRSEGGLLSFKARLLGDDDDDPALALVGGVHWGRHEHQSFRRDSLALGLAGTLPLPQGFTAHANLGHYHDHAEHQRSTVWALALEKALTDTLDLGAEVFGDDRGRPWRGLGLRWAAMPRLSIGSSYAVQAGSGRSRLVTLGFTLGF